MYNVRTEQRPNQNGLDGTVYILADADGGTVAEIWPALGFNCYRWQATHKGQALDLLYHDPKLFAGGKPTRSGIPVLCPFPNRIRAGRFSWQGNDYTLPLGDSTGQNAIHGWACRHPWRVIDQGATATDAWVTGEFHAAVDAAETRALWPADYCLRLTVRLAQRSLRLEAVIVNPDRVSLPFGLGYHPYLRVPFVPGDSAQDYRVDSTAREYWELVDSLPTGRRPPVTGGLDLTQGQPFSALKLDDVLTDLEGEPPASESALVWRGQLRRVDVGVQLLTTPAFGQLVVFTPEHRQAMCLEPYTCTTDAINLQQRGVASGLLVLEPGAEWRGVVEFRCAVPLPK